MFRKSVNKNAAARSFGRQVKRTKKANLASPMRGGIRL